MAWWLVGYRARGLPGGRGGAAGGGEEREAEGGGGEDLWGAQAEAVRKRRGALRWSAFEIGGFCVRFMGVFFFTFSIIPKLLRGRNSGGLVCIVWVFQGRVR